MVCINWYWTESVHKGKKKGQGGNGEEEREKENNNNNKNKKMIKKINNKRSNKEKY